jgi:hypothetical protein
MEYLRPLQLIQEEGDGAMTKPSQACLYGLVHTLTGLGLGDKWTEPNIGPFTIHPAICVLKLDLRVLLGELRNGRPSIDSLQMTEKILLFELRNDEKQQAWLEVLTVALHEWGRDVVKAREELQARNNVSVCSLKLEG